MAGWGGSGGGGGWGNDSGADDKWGSSNGGGGGGWGNDSGGGGGGWGNDKKDDGGWGGGGGGDSWGGGGGGGWDKPEKTPEEMMAAKEAKLKREIEHYWQQQQWQEGPLRRTEDEVKADYDELFSDYKTIVCNTAGVDFNKYDKIPVERAGTGADQVAPLNKFSDLGDLMDCPEFILRNLKYCGYSNPTPIQKHAIPFGLAGRDLMCCAQTGSGKTCAFLLPIFCKIGSENGMYVQEAPFEGACDPPAVVMAPTRELCTQIYHEARKFSYDSPFKCAQVYGGTDAKEQLSVLATGVDLLVATPGRLIDFIDRKVLTMEFVETFVLDEADRMLDMGFEPQIRRIVQDRGMSSGLPEGHERQTFMFSATFPKEIQKLARDFLGDYIWIAVGVVGGAVDSIKQDFVFCEKNEKQDKLFEQLEEKFANATRALIFVNSKTMCATLNDVFTERGVQAETINGDMQQHQRESALYNFRQGTTRVLLGTDVASRGLDIPSVDVVINYDLPNDIDSYIHRIGRTGRIGNEGKALTFLTSSKYGGCNENVQVVKELVHILKQANQDIPEWMQELCTGGGGGYGGGAGDWGSGGGGWGAKDAREGEAGWGQDKTDWDNQPDKQDDTGDDKWDSSATGWATEEKKAEEADAWGGAGDGW